MDEKVNVENEQEKEQPNLSVDPVELFKDIKDSPSRVSGGSNLHLEEKQENLQKNVDAAIEAQQKEIKRVEARNEELLARLKDAGGVEPDEEAKLEKEGKAEIQKPTIDVKESLSMGLRDRYNSVLEMINDDVPESKYTTGLQVFVAGLMENKDMKNEPDEKIVSLVKNLITKSKYQFTNKESGETALRRLGSTAANSTGNLNTVVDDIIEGNPIQMKGTPESLRSFGVGSGKSEPVRALNDAMFRGKDNYDSKLNVGNEKMGDTKVNEAFHNMAAAIEDSG